MRSPTNRSILVRGAIIALVVIMAAGALLWPTAGPTTATGPTNSIETVDKEGDVGRYTSLELDAAGNPVISYYDQTDGP